MRRRLLIYSLILSFTVLVGCGQKEVPKSTNPLYCEEAFGEDEFQELDALCRKDKYSSAYILYDKVCDTKVEDLNDIDDIVIPKNYKKTQAPVKSHDNLTDIDCRNYIVSNMDKCSHNNENSPYTITVERLYRGRITTTKDSKDFLINGVIFNPEHMGFVSDRTEQDNKILKKKYSISFITNKDLENYTKSQKPLNLNDMSTPTQTQNFWGQVYVSYVCNKHVDKIRVYVTDYTGQEQKYNIAYKPFIVDKRDLNYKFTRNEMTLTSPNAINLIGSNVLQFCWNKDMIDTSNLFLYSNFTWKLDSFMKNQYLRWGGLTTIFNTSCDSGDIELAIMYPPIVLRQDYYIKGASKPLINTVEILAPNVFKLGNPVYIKHLISSKLGDTFYVEQ